MSKSTVTTEGMKIPCSRVFFSASMSERKTCLRRRLL
jgi:hypothetical protein